MLRDAPKERGVGDCLSVCGDGVMVFVGEVDEAGLQRSQDVLDELQGII